MEINDSGNLMRFKISFFTLKEQLNLEIQSQNEELINSFIEDLLVIFSVFNPENESFIISALQTNTEAIKEKIHKLADDYTNIHPSVSKIPAFFRRLILDELFIFVPDKELSDVDHIRLSNYLRASIEGSDYSKLQNQTDSLFSELLKTFEISSYGTKRILIGTIDKAERVCRFCNNKRVQLTFKSEAHAISEGLGNKTVILLDECDGCNSEFSKNVEQDIIHYLSLYRTFFGVKGKDGSKNFTGRDFEIKKDKSVVFTVLDDNIETVQGVDQKITLKSDYLITRQHIYKTLCKYFLSVIDAKYLPDFKKTIDWINGEYELSKLPKIAEMITYHSFSLQPKLVTYIRKSKDDSLPFAVGEFYFTCMLFVFIVPLTGQNSSDFIGEDYKHFWNTFLHFNKTPGWTFNDYSSNRKGTFTIHVKLNKRE